MLQAEDVPIFDDISIALSGGIISDAERDALEGQVRANPEDRKARVRLVGYYFGRQSLVRVPHVLWIIAHLPDADFAGSPFCAFYQFDDPDAYVAGVRAWQVHTERDQVPAEVLLHAAAYLGLSQPEVAEALLRRGMLAYPRNARFPDNLARALALREPPKSAESLALFEQALVLLTGKEDRFYLLAKVAQTAFEAKEAAKAKAYAEELLVLAAAIDDWNTGNAIHHVNLVLGRLALQEGRVELTCDYLRKAGGIKGSPRM